MTLASGIAGSRGPNDGPSLLVQFSMLASLSSSMWPISWKLDNPGGVFPLVLEVPGWAVTSPLGHMPVSEPFADATWTCREGMVPAKPQGWRVGKT